MSVGLNLISLAVVWCTFMAMDLAAEAGVICGKFDSKKRAVNTFASGEVLS